MLTLAIAIAVLTGWAFHIPSLKSVLPGFITMKVNTALSFALSSLVMYGLLNKSPKWKNVFLSLSMIVIAINVATLIEYLAHVNFGLDEFFIADPDGIGGRFPPGRLAPITAINFILISVSLLLAKAERGRSVFASQIVAAIVFFASFQGLVGYVIGVNYLFGSAFYTQMAIHTAIGFVLLSTATMFLSPQEGFMRSFTARTPTARITRWMFLAAALVPPLLRSLALIGFQHGLYDQDFSQLIQTAGITCVMAIIIGIVGSNMYRTEEDSFVKQASLAESEAKFQILSNSIPQLSWMTDRTGAIHWYNQRWYDYTGTTLEEMKDWGWQKVHHPDYVTRVTEKFKHHVANGTPWEDTFPLRSKKGEWRWFLSRAIPIRDSHGLITAWIGSNTDVTETRENAEALRASREQAENASRAKTQFLANMSHEIRTPVGAIIGFTDLLKSPSTKPDEAEKYIEVVDRNSHQLLRLIDDILDLSKVEAGKVTLENQPLNLRTFMNEFADTTKDRASAKGIVFDMIVADSVPEEIFTDSLRLRQILSNLIGNAIKFTEAGRITMSVTYRFPLLSFNVKDTGIGLSKEQVPQLFQAFGQADSSMNRRFGGTGLGLILSKRLCQALGGDLVLESTAPGRGSSFVASIQSIGLDEPSLSKSPRIPQEKSTPAKSLDAKQQLAGMNILLVEDSPDNQVLIRTYLSKSGAQVTIAENGQIGVEKALAIHPDLILMDVQMPVMDGHEATRKLRESGFAKPIIALTAHAMREDRDRCLASGCTDYLTKPIEREVLVGALSKYSKTQSSTRV